MVLKEKKLPNFLLVGATKAATTWLYQCLKEHSEIFVPSLKEVNYFSYRYSEGESWYLSFFEDVAEQKAIGELSPSYMICDDSPQRIYSLNPNMRLIFMLRDPIERAYSQYCMELRYNTVSENIEQEFDLESTIVQESLYYKHISAFTKLFPQENLKFIIYDDIKTNPQQVLSNLFEFLSVDAEFENPAIFKQSYAKLPRQKFARLYTLAVAVYRWINNNNSVGRKILNNLKSQGFNDKFHQLNSVEKEYPQLSIDKKRELANFYQEDIKQLSQLLDRDLNHWLSI